MKTLFAFLLSTLALGAVNPASNMKLAFSDEFDADKLDETKWVVSGDRTVLSFVKVGKASAIRISLLKREDMIQYNGINTRGKFEQARGYFEASIRMNAYKGHGASMVLRGKDEKVTPFAMALWESQGDDKITPWIRILDDKGQHEMRPERQDKTALKPGEAAKKFNTYGILWTEKSFSWFVNGKQVHKVDRVVVDAPMSLHLSHRIGEWERPNLNLKQLPDDVDIDWVKIWK
jgi:beta-glucanase (GH16 family)